MDELVRKGAVIIGLVGIAALAPRTAGAQETAPALFAEGQRLMSQGKAAEACPKFEKALSLAAQSGTKFNLADCYEKTGKLATSLTLYRQVEDATRQAGQAERSALAKKRADALEPRVPSVVVHAPWWASTPRASITFDGRQLSPGELDKPIRVDMGSHEAIARLDTSETKAQVAVDKERDSKTLAVEAPKVAVVAPPVTPVATIEPPHDEPASRGGAQRTAGIVVGGLGLVAAGVGAVVVLGANSSYSDATSECGTTCPPDKTAEANDARDSANFGGIVLGVGVVALVTGAVLFFTAPRSPSSPGATTARSSRSFQIAPMVPISRAETRGPIGLSATGTF